MSLQGASRLMLAYIMHSSKGVFCCRYDFRECIIDIIAEMNQVKPIFRLFSVPFFSFYHFTIKF